MEILSPSQARRIILHCQKLATSPPRGKENLARTIEHLGYLQIDTISVLQRAHHHVAWSRLANYQPKFLQQLEEKDRRVFEYWAHAASYLPMKDYRFTLYKKNHERKGDRHWFKKDKKLMQHILDRIKTEGPLMSKDFEDTRKEKPAPSLAWDWKPAKKQLWLLFMEGRLMVAGRQGFHKLYDLPQNILPWEVNTSIPTREQYINYLIDRDLRTHGLIKKSEVGHLINGIKQEVDRAIDKKCRKKEIMEVAVTDLDGSYYITPSMLETSHSFGKKRVHILSPFDNLIIQRKRIKELFKFDYALECYVPKNKRKFGYFALPLLWGTQFIGQIDLKADRKTKTVYVNNLQLERSVKHLEASFPGLREKLDKFALFNHCESIKWSKELEPHYPKELITEI